MTAQEIFEYALKFFAITQCLIPLGIIILLGIGVAFLNSDTAEKIYRWCINRKYKF